ncbi:putative peptidase S49, ClpP/crotonase-like domain-containing protein [Medicago truncatula]|uniref:Putative peptidase S49, ClpP/crotonase-like domain-containing protein n=1 Tax=Medicago truncatula TaxID=3880 RepID=A0A396I2T2_MEDTR|nr:putative peptidase S49, ClpP/crotonase-like domain-containing protein [Medicago truncatula]
MISFRKYSKGRKWTVAISEAKEQIAIIRVSGNMVSDIVTSNFIEKIGMVSKKLKAVIVQIDSVMVNRGKVSQNFNLDNDDVKVLDNVVHLRLMTLGKLDKMKKVAHGRIWTGKDAASHGLVDAIGGISRAIAIAKLKANIPQNRQVNVCYCYCYIFIS